VAGINYALWNAEVLLQKQPENSFLEFPSLGMRSAVQFLSSISHPTIVDLAAPNPQNVDFFSGFGAKIFYEELPRSFLPSEPRPDDVRLVQELQDYGVNANLSVILAWDLFNYLQESEIRGLVNHLDKYAQKGTLLLVMISTISNLPKDPCRCRVVASDKISYEITTKEVRRITPITQLKLLQILDKWELVRSLHLRNSMQENLYIFK